MKAMTLFLTLAVSIVAGASANARDTRHMISIEEAMATPDAQSRLNQGVRFYFGDQEHSAVARTFGDFTSNKKTNAFNKSDREACLWVFLSAMLSLQQRALAEGGDAVVNIRSYYKKNTISSATVFECAAGGLMAGVALRGEVVKLEE